MTYSRSTAHSPYMDWAKLHSAAKFNLATSGVANFPLSKLGVTIDQLEINGPSIYGYEPLIQAIARRYRVPAGMRRQRRGNVIGKLSCAGSHH